MDKINRYIAVRKVNGLITGGEAEYVEIWPVPEDFSTEEELLLTEICANGSLSPQDARVCVRLLRYQAQ